MTDVIKIIFTSAFSVIALFLLTKLMGKKQISQLNLFDYINGITIGSIAAEMATALEHDFWLPLTAMIVYTLFSVLISMLERKSVKLNKFLVGNTTILYHNGVLYEKNLIRSKISIPEFLSQCRIGGYYNLADLDTAVLEPNGLISFLPKASVRPATPQDLNLTPQQEVVLPNVILDGKIMKQNLAEVGFDEVWLVNELHKQGINSPAAVFLATCDKQGTLSAYIKEKKPDTREPFL